MFDAMSQRYGVLPSKLLKEADTFDLTVMDVALTWQNFKQKQSSKTDTTDMYGQENLQKIMDKAKGL